MTTRRNADRAANRKTPQRDVAMLTFDAVLCDAIEALQLKQSRLEYAWPSPTFLDDPVRFAEECLGVKLNRLQKRIAMAVARNQRVVVRSGRKIGKSLLAAVLALWFYCTREDAQVFLTATVARQVGQIVWREIRKLVDRAPVGIDGQMNLLAANGLVSGFRSITGFAAQDREAAAGISGVNIFYIVDEASGVATEIFETIDGNMAGGGKLFAISNPTQNEGWHFKAFFDKGGDGEAHDLLDYDGIVHFTVSSETIADEDGGKTPGLATRAWIEYMRRKYGEDSAEFIVHVQGRHAINEEGRAFSFGLVAAAVDRHYTIDTSDVEPLQIGFDPAGDSDKGDLATFAVRRGFKIIEVKPLSGLERGAWLPTLEDLIATHKRYDGEVVNVIYDTGGEVGAKLLPDLRDLERRLRFKLYTVRSSDNAIRHLHATDRRSAELVWNLRLWLKAGGAIPDDEQLIEEFRAWEFYRIKADSEKVKVNKDEVRKRIGRSPDRFDACALAAWDPIDVEHQRRPVALPVRQAPAVRRWDPQQSSRNGSLIDPFGGRGRRV